MGGALFLEDCLSMDIMHCDVNVKVMCISSKSSSETCAHMHIGMWLRIKMYSHACTGMLLMLRTYT